MSLLWHIPLISDDLEDQEVEHFYMYSESYECTCFDANAIESSIGH
jgi:hypothetical protein